MSWGSSTADESKPNWTWLTTVGRGNTAPKSANVVATEKGWAMRWPWGLETLVAIGGLATALGIANVASLHVAAPSEKPNVASQTLTMLVSFNEPVEVTGTPTIRAITSGGPANVSLAYVSASSDPTTGRLIFANTTANLGAAAGAAGVTATVNSTSVVTGFDGITDAGNANAVANGVPAALSAQWTIVSALPFQSVNVPSGTVEAADEQTVSFILGFNRAVTLINASAVMSLRAITSGDVTVANAVLTFVSAVNATHLLFSSPEIDLSGITENVTFTVNSTSTLVGFANITDLNGNVAANTISTANSVLVESA